MLNKKNGLIFLMFILMIGVAWAFVTPQSITRQPTLNENSILYAYEPTAGVWNAVNVDTSGNLMTSSSGSGASGPVSVTNQFTQIPVSGWPTQIPFQNTATPTATPILARITSRTFTAAQSSTPTPIVTAVSGSFNHVQLFMNNTGTAGDTITIYFGAISLPVYLAPAGGIVTKSIWDMVGNVPISIAGGTVLGSSINVWGTLDQQTYQVPVNLPTQ